MFDWKPGQPVKLQTKRFHIRSLTGLDASDTLLSWLTDEKLTYYIGGPRSLSNVQDLAQMIQRQDNKRDFLLGVIREGRLVGVYWVEINYKDWNARTHHLFGDKRVWGSNAPLECRTAILNWLFLSGVERVFGSPMAGCRAAIYGYKKQGFVLEGVLKSAMLHQDGTRHDIMMYRMLRSEWEEIRSRGKPS